MRAASGRASAETVCSCLSKNATPRPATNAHKMATIVKCGQTLNVFITPPQIFLLCNAEFQLMISNNQTATTMPRFVGDSLSSEVVWIRVFSFRYLQVSESGFARVSLEY